MILVLPQAPVAAGTTPPFLELLLRAYRRMPFAVSFFMWFLPFLHPSALFPGSLLPLSGLSLHPSLHLLTHSTNTYGALPVCQALF